MLPQPQTAVLLLLGIAASAAAQSLPTLVEALVSSGASKFAEFIQSDPETLQLYLSGQVGTVFAPSDVGYDLISVLGRDLSVTDRRAAAFQSSRATTSLETSSRSIPGSILETNYQSPLLGGQGQRVVIDTRPANLTSPTKRWMQPSFLRRQSNGTTPSLLKISSGLGKITNVIKGDIPYNGGLLHITDGYFTQPESLSSTAQSTGQTAFAGLLSRSNTTSTVESTQSVTVFLPSNEAISASNSSLPASQLVSDHVIAGNVAYLPDLKDGDILKTQRGESLAISIRAGRYYVNGGLITQANLILENGVAHVVNKVLTPTPAVPVTGAASFNSMSLGGLFGVACFMGMMVLA
ncbi:FAS1 domain-containing protein [Annulohypoxylon maeteangense]|uniref:FAS1 domain-containing protein n=1 Tax=Annulohypoxylon maeteangense TaxID=1927788 RepID=UPI0020086A1E|nr:FAS1 domain-containing protein [Annulohypoxylon maeteangense]KAI0887798.1 FAS1 domain-containing protein [Annulohypoxylon maeteangense]